MRGKCSRSARSESGLASNAGPREELAPVLLSQNWSGVDVDKTKQLQPDLRRERIPPVPPSQNLALVLAVVL